MSTFLFKYFQIQQEKSAMKVGTDALVLGALIQKPYVETILDVGTGTGVIALMLAQKFPNAHLLALELDEEAAAEAAANFAQSSWSNRLRVEQANYSQWENEAVFDLVVSNPPYYQTTQKNDDPRYSLARHVGELTPFCFFEKSLHHLSENGQVWIIIPAENEEQWLQAAQGVRLTLAERIEIYGKISGPVKRLVLCFEKNSANIKHSSLCIRDETGKYTEEYIQVTVEFHGVDLTH